MTNARFASLHGLPVAPSPSRRRPFHFANRALVTSGTFLARRMSGVLPSEVWRRRSGCAASRISFRPLRLPLHAVKLPTEASSANSDSADKSGSRKSDGKSSTTCAKAEHPFAVMATAKKPTSTKAKYEVHETHPDRGPAHRPRRRYPERPRLRQVR